ncbi:MAG TPA: hypothetical protein DCS07_16435 [Bdellovibrionales bacterium]|nr:MAG: hypothetical protein A2Z97_15775 [Bdellovibrionales bacterium GWB1_52_6]OFZ06429.1 MAG: hypothetical protein A2X97_03140 [Bdellovibrionales bacterium GWA1_52_35]HAR44193.1 hypothetical protein [Bdellovibrionales bacterium]
MFKRILPLLVAFSLLGACNGSGALDHSMAVAVGTPVLPDTTQRDPANPPVGELPPNTKPSDSANYTKAVLLFNGTGVSTSDWQSTEAILKTEGLSYDLANSAQLNAMNLATLTTYGMIIIPGGSGGTITSNLTPETRLRVRQAVREYGLGFVGFCAGAWVAVGPEAETAKIASYGLAIAKGSVLSLFTPGTPGGSTPTAAMVPVTLPNSSKIRSLVWWGGPSTPEWANGVVARYQETGQPAISETFAGKGLVVISGPHPEAPLGWRATAGNDVDGLDYDIAVDMIRAALDKKPLPTY